MIWLLLLMAASAYGQAPGADAEARSALKALAAHYARCEGVYIEAVMKEPAPGPEGALRKRTAFSSSGSFAIVEFNGAAGKTEFKGNTVHAVFFDGTTIRAHEQPGQYSDYEPGAAYLHGLGPVHFLEAPWAILGRWSEALLGAEDLVGSKNGDVFTVSSESVGLRLDWAADNRLLGAEWIRGPVRAGIRVKYSDFAAVDGFSLPRSVAWTFEVGNEKPPVGRRMAWAVERIGVNPPDLAGRLAFDSRALGLDRFDRQTRNVYAPDGTFKYNEDEYVAEYKRAFYGSSVYGKYVYGLIGLAAAGSLFLAYRRFRPRVA